MLKFIKILLYISGGNECLEKKAGKKKVYKLVLDSKDSIKINTVRFRYGYETIITVNENVVLL